MYTELEQGDLFCVTRGFELNNSSFLFTGLMGMSIQPTDTKVRYDRRYDGIIFRAGYVAGPMVAAVAVAVSDSDKAHYLGKPLSMNLTEIEIMPVTEQYLDVLRAAGPELCLTEQAS